VSARAIPGVGRGGSTSGSAPSSARAGRGAPDAGGGGADADWRDVARAEELPPGAVRPAQVAGVRLAVGRAREGFFAVDGLCPHAGAILGEGLVEGGLLICPQHAYAFDVATGFCDDDPTCSVRSYRVRVEGGTLQVDVGARASRAGRAGHRGAATRPDPGEDGDGG